MEHGVECGLIRVLSKELERKDVSILTPSFEWVTNFSSISNILDPSILVPHQHAGKVLSVSSRSSTLVVG